MQYRITLRGGLDQHTVEADNFAVMGGEQASSYVFYNRDGVPIAAFPVADVQRVLPAGQDPGPKERHPIRKAGRRT